MEIYREYIEEMEASGDERDQSEPYPQPAV